MAAANFIGVRKLGPRALVEPFGQSFLQTQTISAHPPSLSWLIIGWPIWTVFWSNFARPGWRSIKLKIWPGSPIPKATASSSGNQKENDQTWCARQDLNLQPFDPKSNALSN